jgi:hypothetical protein
VWRSQLNPNQLAHAALYHRYAVRVGLGDGAFIVRNDDKLTLLHEPITTPDKRLMLPSSIAASTSSRMNGLGRTM